jgi:hypothetical protein
MPQRHKRYRGWLLAPLLIIVLAVFVQPAAAQSANVRPHPNGKQLARPDGRTLFVFGYNYEGPFDRAWEMWQRFDADLIANDLARARGGGANTVRIFVQQPLPAEIMAGDFRKLDTVVDLAARQGLLVLLTLADYDSRDLVAVAEVNRRIAEQYRANPNILAYDLRNEPQFLTLASATYPPGVVPPMQRTDLIGIYGERVARSTIASYRSSPDGRVLPAWWTDEQVYAYANNLAFFRAFLADAERWTGAASGRAIVDFPNTPEAQAWAPFWGGLDQTLAAWIESQRGAIRASDSNRMITIGWSNPLLARLPANGALLEFISLHRFPQPRQAAVNQVMDLADGLRRAFPGRPVLLEEIGFATSEIDPDGAAVLEMALALRAYSEGYAGYLKWMLTDLPPVGNPREDSFGVLRIDASPKPLYHTFGAFGTYLANTAAAPGGNVLFWDRADGMHYTYATRDAHYLTGPEEYAPGVGIRIAGLGQVLLRKRGDVFLLSTQPGEVTLNLRQLMPPWTSGATVEQRAGESWAPVAASLRGEELKFAIQPATAYRVRLGRATDPAGARPGCRYFSETRHNLCGAFLAYWERNGGLAIFGLPISEEFSELNPQENKTYQVQYFERNRFEYHPELAGTPYEVLLGLLGNDLTATRRGEGPFLPVAGPPPNADFFPETGHSLGGAFRSYWQRHGGLAVFGFPTSEEFQEYNPADGRIYTVQYFERNRFEYHPELAGTPYEVLLGLLGNQVVDGNGWR